MASKKAKPVLYRRKRERKTDYKRRLKLLESGIPRVVLRNSNSKLTAQIVKFDVKGDKVLVGVDSNSLKKQGWDFSKKSFPAFYLTGLNLAKVAKSKNIKGDLIFDAGLKVHLKKVKFILF